MNDDAPTKARADFRDKMKATGEAIAAAIKNGGRISDVPPTDFQPEDFEVFFEEVREKLRRETLAPTALQDQTEPCL